MSPTDADIVIEALKKVPGKQLLIIELVNRVGLKGGGLDQEELLRIQPEVTLAVAEATAYARQTQAAITALIRVLAVQEGELV